MALSRCGWPLCLGLDTGDLLLPHPLSICCKFQLGGCGWLLEAAAVLDDSPVKLPLETGRQWLPVALSMDMDPSTVALSMEPV